MSSVDHLLLDIGNSKAALGAYCGAELVDQRRHDIRGSWLEEVEMFLRSLPSPSKETTPISVLISSVNTPASQKVEELLRRHGMTFHQLSPEELSLPLEVQAKNEVGTDRIADCYGALATQSLHAITIDFGTAIVVNAVHRDRGFLGGVILPGLGMASRALSQQTYLLPFVSIEDRPDRCPSGTTDGNIQAGIYYGAIGAVKELVQRIDEECFPNHDRHVVATGGLFWDEGSPLATALRRDLAGVVDIVDPLLSLNGLQQIYSQHQKEHWFTNQ